MLERSSSGRGVILLNDSEPEQISAMASEEQHRGINIPKPLDTKGLFSLKKTLKDEATESSKKVLDILPRIYPSRSGISAIRCFPEGCGRKTSQYGNDVGVEANRSKASGLEQGISCMEGMSFEEAIESDAHKIKAVMKILPRAYPPRRITSATRSFPKNCGRKVSQASKKVGGEIIASKAEDSIRQCGSMDHPQGQVPTDLALPVSRKIVLGLMASLKCPWSQIIASKAEDSISPISQCGSMDHPQGQVPTDLALPVSRKIVLGLMASLKCPWRQVKGHTKTKFKQIGKKKH